ncbi:amino acid ABC transporter ATP-binding/permease protein [Levilactobacillus acidifarinae]|uniref:ABC-type multidrug transport system, ATPase and permease component n=1 Tax=Levilactobacillus acidifarinae DSM 19394 = JCM 15949 TaxID=1423715 RepID=A0A0R1LFN6_9LACO|nr:ABC transporter ATP-binding protein [Levilactobacillus acidifarinae]KRK94421.1 ABC-type multidrug transport system, ATPase and permease component [Levilactobacillus acidifarinae DSM 19394]GEO68161.1 multidrug ABC transporter permease [Levilactobacillus acidifarinae]
MSLFKRLLVTAGRLNWVLAASILAGLAATGFQLGLLWGGFTVLFHPIPFWWVWLLVLALVGGLCRFGEQYLGHLAAFKILAHLRNLTYQQLLRLAPAKLDDQRSSDVLKLLAQDIGLIEIFYAHTLAPVVIGSLTAVSFVIIFGLASPWLGLIALIAYAGIGLGVPLATHRRLKPLTTELNARDLQEQRQLAEALTGQRELQQYQATSTRLAQLDQATHAYWQVNRQKALRQTQTAVIMQLIVVLSLMAVIGVVVTQHLSLVWAVLFPFTFSRLLALGNLPGSLSGGLLAAQNVFDFLDETPRVTAGSAQLGPLQRTQLQQVDFAYPQRPTEPILRHTDLTVTAGERLGLVGPSGAGKSTIVKLIMRWYAADRGTVTFNGQAGETLSLAAVRQAINYVPQTAQIFTGTLRENLTLRDEQLTDERLWQVLDWLDLAATVRRLPDQLNTRVSPNRPVLSAGEGQRLELARALVQPSALLILDEPTSNLDVLNEALILKTVRQHYAGTVILVTHRPSSLALCDRVLALRDGRLVPVDRGAV